MNDYIRRNLESGQRCRQLFMEINHTIGNPGARAAWLSASHVERPPAKKPPAPPTP